MFLIEAIIALAILMLILSAGLLIVKFVFGLILLPLKLAFFLTKGLLGLVIVLPLLLIVGTVVTAVLPLALLIFLLPILLVGGITCAIVGV